MIKETVPNRRLLLLITCLGVFMAALDGTMVIISLPQMAAYFHCSLAQISWVMIAYLIVCASLLLSCGRLGDLSPPGRLFLLGLLEFTLASIFCGLSQEWFWLVINRGVQGLGASLILASRSKLVARIFDAGERGLPLGLVSAAMAIGVIIGAPLGGFITNHLGWRYIFFINIPLCGLALIVGGRSLVQLPAESSCDLKSCNLRSGLILAGAVGGLFLSLDWLRDRGCDNCYTLVSFALAAGLFGLLLYLDRQHCDPLLHPELWHNKTFLFGSVGVMPASVAFQGTFFILPFFIEHVYRYPPHHSGLLLIPLAVTSSIAAPLSGFLADRWGNLFILRIGAAILAVGLASLLFTSPVHSIVRLVPMFALIGLGYGLFHTPNLNEVLVAMQPSMVGLAASSVSLLKNFGAIFGITLIVGVFAWEHQHDICLSPGVCLEIQYFHLAFAAMAIIAGINFLIHLFYRR
jgi:EmrB/QacA subfamily drug resistance transporter